MTLSAAGIRYFRLVALNLQFKLGSLRKSRSRYGIAAGYRHRTATAFDDASGKTDEWQKEVYEAARSLMLSHNLRAVHDVGCGSGYKLVHILGEFDTTGIDLEENIEWVRQAYPDRKWIAGSFERICLPPADLVICADVIEHVADPDALFRFIAGIARGLVVMSTPDRSLLYGWRSPFRFGPPENPTHLREWNRREFHRYASRYLHIDRHEITNREQGTQMIIGRVRR